MVSFKKFFGRNNDEVEIDPLVDYSLGKMKVGFLVDYDLKTWQVTATTDYDYDGFPAQEWELRSKDDVRFLERSVEDGETEWTLTRRISLREIEGDVPGTILDDGEPPEVVAFDGIDFSAEESSTGTRVVSGSDGESSEEEREFVSWSYGSENGRILFVVQSGDRDFAAYEGEYVEEYQFTTILPNV